MSYKLSKELCGRLYFEKEGLSYLPPREIRAGRMQILLMVRKPRFLKLKRKLNLYWKELRDYDEVVEKMEEAVRRAKAAGEQHSYCDPEQGEALVFAWLTFE